MFLVSVMPASANNGTGQQSPNLHLQDEDSSVSFKARPDDLGTAPPSPTHLDLRQTAGDIEVDGQLNDPGWVGAAILKDFLEAFPGDQTVPAVPTTAWVTYDKTNLYVSCVCYDKPDEIRATYCERDQLVGNDVIVLAIDTYGQATWAYTLYVNPLGVQTDAIYTAAGDDFAYNVIYESAGLITDSGYQVEIAVPFSSLRFPNRSEQTWKFNVYRIRPRESWYDYGWSAYDRNNPCRPCQWGTISINADIRSGRGLEILPSTIAYQTGEATGGMTPEDPYLFKNYDPEGELSLNAKYRPAPSMSYEITVNPDFSQIEPDAAQIDVNTTSALFYPERRPFFQEASELFYTWRLAYYSRMINDPSFALKASGQTASTDLGYIFAIDEHSPFIRTFRDASIALTGDKSYSNVLRLRHTFTQDTWGALLVTDRRVDGGGAGTVFNFDGQLRLHRSWRLQAQAMASRIDEPDDDGLSEQIAAYVDWGWIDSTFDKDGHTAAFDGESYWGHYIMFNIEERSQHLNFDVGYIEISPSYQSDLGFLRSNNWRSFETFGHYTMYSTGWMEEIEPSFGVISRWDFDGRKRYEEFSLGLRATLAGQLNLRASVLTGSEYYRGVYFDDIWEASITGSKSFSEQVFLRATSTYGRQISRSYLVPGKETSIELYAYLRPHDRLLIEPEYEYIKSIQSETDARLYEGYIFRTRMNYFFSRNFTTRLIVQYNDIYETLNVDPLITYRINPFTVLHAGTSYEYCQMLSTENGYEEKNSYLNQRQFFIKLQYLLQI